MAKSKEILRKRLKQMRKASGLSQDAFSEKIGISLRAYQKYEQGESEPKIATLEKMSQILGCEIGDFYTEDSQKTMTLADLSTPAGIDLISKKIAENLSGMNSTIQPGPFSTDIFKAWNEAGEIERILALLILTGDHKYLKKLDSNHRRTVEQCLEKMDQLVG